jgi:pimeloyl-ACP methyl ester carboxylesterase
MKSTLKLRSFIAAFGSAALLATGLVVASPAHAGICTTDATTGVETCISTLPVSGAAFKTMVPTKNYNGTMFFWNHGFRPSYDYPGYKAPTGVEQITISNTGPTPKLDYSTELLAKGYGLASYDRVTGGLHGWNTEESVPLLKELVDYSKLIAPTTKRNVIWGSSGAGPVVNMFAEKYPELTDAVGLISPVATNISRQLQSGCDIFYLLSVFADPTIKGCAALGAPGIAGHGAALTELGKVVALLTAWKANLGQPGLAYPAAVVAGNPAFGAIPQRSALLLIGLLSGIPQKSVHMDGITTSAVVVEQSINATVAILENIGEAAATGILAGQAVAEKIGGPFYDNSKTNYATLLDEGDAGRYNLGLSGDDGINGMLGVLAQMPRVSAPAANVAKAAALDPVKYTSTKPTVLLANENDRLVWPGQTSAYVAERNAKFAPTLAAYESALAAYQSTVTTYNNKITKAKTAVTNAKTATAKKKAKAALASAKAKAAPVEPTKPSSNVLALYAMAPVEYTKYTATGAPDLADVGASSGVGHEQFSTAQIIAMAEMLDAAATSGKLDITLESFEIFGAGLGLNGDLDYLPIPLKY